MHICLIWNWILFSLGFKAVLEFKHFMPILNCEDVLFVMLVWNAGGWKNSWRNWYHAKAVFLCMEFRISWRNVHQINSECFVCVADTAQVRKSPLPVEVCMAFHTHFPAGDAEAERALPAGRAVPRIQRVERFWWCSVGLLFGSHLENRLYWAQCITIHLNPFLSCS